MKSTIKIFVVFAMVLSFAIVSKAQTNSDNDKILGKATIIQAMNVTKQIDLNFGIVSQGSNKTIGLSNDVTGLPNQGTQTTGRFLVSAAPTTSVKLTFTTPGNLVKGSDNLTIDTYTYGYGNTNDGSTATTFTGGTKDVTFPTNIVETVNGIYVFIGGTVKPSGTQAPGEYSADITLTATYN
jgi:hypothetical protein